MRHLHLVSLLASLASLAPAAAVAAGLDLSPAPLGPWRGAHAPGEVLVKFRRDAATSARAAALAARRHALLGEVAGTPWVHVKTAPGESVEAALAAYAANPDVEWAQPNYLYRAAAAPNDGGFGYLWAARNTGQAMPAGLVQPGGFLYGDGAAGTPGDDMKLEPAWNVTTDCRAVIVAVVDSGVNFTHVDLAPNMWDGSAQGFANHGRNFVGSAAGDEHTMDLHGHGTHVAGTIGAAGNNAAGVAGVCWRATLMAIRVMDETGAGSTASVIPGIVWAAEHGAKVINMSLGSEGVRPYDQAYADAIGAALDADAVVVVAAGNEGKDNDAVNGATWPCNFTHPNLVCVAALDQDFALARFSNFGSTSVDVGAPGTDILSTWPGEGIAISLGSGWGANTAGLSYWSYAPLPVPGGSSTGLVIPPGFPAGTYPASADLRAWTTVTLPAGAIYSTLHLRGSLRLSTGDTMTVAWAPGAGDPFSSASVHGQTFHSDANTPGPYDYADVALPMATSCGTGPCSIGFQLRSGSTTGGGAAIAELYVSTIEDGSQAYHLESGTSMAAPNAAGVAALIRARNPSYTSAETVAALRGGAAAYGAAAGLAGDLHAPALVGSTATGYAVNAMGSLLFIQPPRGVTATGAVVQ